ncbi:MAG: signal recognition particle protein [Armatimonadetes bacterium]|nr:signal recognition particle protein [Armatimonadota bacterium]
MLDNLTRRLAGVFAGLRKKGRLNEDDVTAMLREVRVALLEADVNFAVAKDFVAKVKDKAIGEEVFGSLTADQTLLKIVRDELVDLLGGHDVPFQWSPSPPTVVLMAGLQGSGKTTTCAKLAKWLLKQGKKPLLVACDLQRPAAVKQLEVLGEQVGVPVFGPNGVSEGPTSAAVGGSTDPVAVAKRAMDYARHYFLDVVIVDTAGRLSIDEPLMAELKSVSAAVRPSETFLVLDATAGQEAVNVAQAFHERLTLTGAVFTKLDGDARGGAVLSVKSATEVPVRFIGVGEQVEALDVFHPDRMAERIIGMGDVMGIIAKAEEAFQGEDPTEMLDLQTKMRTGRMDFNDLLQQFRMLRKMGPIKNVMKLMPGMATALPEGALDQIDEKQMDRVQAIVLSMTPHERSNPDILNGSRRRRIARGSGTSQEEVNRLIEQLHQMRKGMKQLSHMEKRMKRFRRR